MWYTRPQLYVYDRNHKWCRLHLMTANKQNTDIHRISNLDPFLEDIGLSLILGYKSNGYRCLLRLI